QGAVGVLGGGFLGPGPLLSRASSGRLPALGAAGSAGAAPLGDQPRSDRREALPAGWAQLAPPPPGGRQGGLAALLRGGRSAGGRGARAGRADAVGRRGPGLGRARVRLLARIRAPARVVGWTVHRDEGEIGRAS